MFEWLRLTYTFTHFHILTFYGDGAFGGMLEGVGDEVAEEDFHQQAVTPEGDAGGLHDNADGVGTGVEALGDGGGGHLVEGEVLGAELQPAGDGEVGPVLDIVEGAQELVEDLLAQRGAEVLVLEVGEEGVDVVPQHGEAGLDIGDTLDILPFGQLEGEGLAPEAHRTPAQHEDENGEDDDEGGANARGPGIEAVARLGSVEPPLQENILALVLADEGEEGDLAVVPS